MSPPAATKTTQGDGPAARRAAVDDRRRHPAAAARARRPGDHPPDRRGGRHRRGHDLPGLRRQGRGDRRGDRGRRSTPQPLEAALGGIPPASPFEDGARGRGRDHAAARHRHLAAGVERRHPLPRDGAPADDRQRRARRASSRRTATQITRRADRRRHGCCARSRCRPRTRCSPASRGRPTSSVQLFLHGVGGNGGRAVLIAPPALAPRARTAARSGCIVVLQTRADVGRADAADAQRAHHRQRRAHRRHRATSARGAR